jgi:hypothetical protein
VHGPQTCLVTAQKKKPPALLGIEPSPQFIATSTQLLRRLMEIMYGNRHLKNMKFFVEIRARRIKNVNVYLSVAPQDPTDHWSYKYKIW